MMQVTSSHFGQPSKHLQLKECQYGALPRLRQLLSHIGYERLLCVLSTTAKPYPLFHNTHQLV
jgi:hypothetical protein